jgi:hypothetical protein
MPIDRRLPTSGIMLGHYISRKLVDSRDVDVLWVVNENLKKNRLIKDFPNEVGSSKEATVII